MNGKWLAFLIALVLILATGCWRTAPETTPASTSESASKPRYFSTQSFNHVGDRAQYDFTLELPGCSQEGKISIEGTDETVLDGEEVLVISWVLDITKEFKNETSTSSVPMKVWANAEGEIVRGEVRNEVKSGIGIEKYLVVPYFASRDISSGDRFTISGASLGEGEIELIAHSNESVSTPAGTFSAMRLTTSDTLDLTIYVSPDVPGGIIKLDMEKGGEQGELRNIVLTSYHDAT